MNDTQEFVRDVGVLNNHRDKEGNLITVMNRRKHLKECVNYLFSETNEVMEKGVSTIFMNFIFKTCLDEPIKGMVRLLESIYFNSDYEENINKHALKGDQKKMIVYVGEKNKEIVKTTGDDTTYIIKQVIEQLLLIIDKMRLKLFKRKSNKEMMFDDYEEFKETISKNNDKLQDEIYKSFTKHRSISIKLYHNYKHLITNK